MRYDTKKEFSSFLRFMESMGFLKEIGTGSQGICYLNLINNKVYKIYHQFFDEDKEYNVEYRKEDILLFSNIINDTFIWANDVIVVENEIIGYVSDFVNARSLYKINPLSVNFEHLLNSVNKVEKDIKIISDNGVVTYDTLYNTLYGKNGIFIIDHDDYSLSNCDKNVLFRINNDNFNLGIMYFLIDNYFDEFISNYKELKEMYGNSGVNISEFIKLFRKYLSEYMGKEVVNLSEALPCLNKEEIKKKKLERYLF